MTNDTVTEFFAPWTITSDNYDQALRSIPFDLLTIVTDDTGITVLSSVDDGSPESMATLYAEDILLSCLPFAGAFHTINTLGAILYDTDEPLANVDDVYIACHAIVTRAMA